MARFLSTVILAIISLLSMAADAPSNSERARQTLSEMRVIRTAVEAYAGAHNAWPQATSMDELRTLVEPRYVKTLPMRDEWGTPFLFELDPNVGYRVISAGADGIFDRKSWPAGGTRRSFNDDAVANGDRAGFFRSWEVR